MSQWQLQTAKQRFSEVIRAVEAGEPQFVTKNGKEVAAIINIEDYRKTHKPKKSFVEFLLSAPRVLEDDEEFLPRRIIDPNRTTELFD